MKQLLLILVLFMSTMSCYFHETDVPIKKQMINNNKTKEEIKKSHKTLDKLSMDSRNLIEKGRGYIVQIKNINLDGHSIRLKKKRELASKKLKDSENEYQSLENKITEARESLNKVSGYIDSWRNPQFIKLQFNYIYIDLITLSLLEFYVELLFSNVENFKAELSSEQENIERLRQERLEREEQERLKQERLEQQTVELERIEAERLEQERIETEQRQEQRRLEEEEEERERQLEESEWRERELQELAETIEESDSIVVKSRFSGEIEAIKSDVNVARSQVSQKSSEALELIENARFLMRGITNSSALGSLRYAENQYEAVKREIKSITDLLDEAEELIRFNSRLSNNIINSAETKVISSYVKLDFVDIYLDPLEGMVDAVRYEVEGL